MGHLKYVYSRQKASLYTIIDHKTAIAILYWAHCTSTEMRPLYI